MKGARKIKIYKNFENKTLKLQFFLEKKTDTNTLPLAVKLR